MCCCLQVVRYRYSVLMCTCVIPSVYDEEFYRKLQGNAQETVLLFL